MTTKNPLDERHLGSASEALTQALELQDHPSYRLSFADSEFLMQDELRPVRLQLEYLKPQLVLEQHKVKATVVVFGSARFLSPEQAALQLAAAQREIERPHRLAMQARTPCGIGRIRPMAPKIARIAVHCFVPLQVSRAA